MKKFFLPISLVILLIIISVFIIVLTENNVSINVRNLTFYAKDNDDFSESELYELGSNKKEVMNVINPKVVYIKCEIKNNGFEDFSLVQLRFADSQNLPDFILSDRLESVYGYKTHLHRFESQIMVYRMLIDASDYTDDEIIEQLKNVNIYATEHIYPYGRDDFKVISNSIKMSCN